MFEWQDSCSPFLVDCSAVSSNMWFHAVTWNFLYTHYKIYINSTWILRYAQIHQLPHGTIWQGKTCKTETIPNWKKKRQRKPGKDASEALRMFYGWMVALWSLVTFAPWQCCVMQRCRTLSAVGRGGTKHPMSLLGGWTLVSHMVKTFFRKEYSICTLTDPNKFIE